MYDAILLPVDGSSAADAALPHAFGLADRYDASLSVLYVADADHDGVSVGGAELLAALEAEGDRVVGDAVSRARDRGLSVTGDVVEGSPAEAILDAADRGSVDLVVMGTHGRTGVRRVLLGSVTERVVRRSSVPVLTVQGSERSDDER